MKKFVLFAALVSFFGFSFVACGSKSEQSSAPTQEVVEDEGVEVEADTTTAHHSEAVEAASDTASK